MFTLFIQTWTSIIGASVCVTLDCTFAIFSTIVKMELHLLKEKFKTMDFSSTNKQIKYELKKNMELYDNIVKITFAIQKIFNYVLLSTFINSIILICLTGFLSTHTVIDEQADLSEKINYVYTLGYFGYLLFQVSVYCYYGHQIMTESSDINEAIYLSNWYVSDKFIQKDLIILRERLKRPIIFKAGNIFPLTFPTLIQVPC
ncbi:hypothetical protein HUJ05_010817 [Dendroctonus ponderosae]|nr:hypothetical protein HUJ05_010817 [Dendroctonus ponderosae]